MSEQLVANVNVCATDGTPATSQSPAADGRGRRKFLTLSALGVVVLFLGYWRLSWTAPVDSDGAANIFQAWDMLHGNVLLHGWWLADVSFYTIDLPQYALIESVLGPVPAVLHLAAAMTYTLAVVMAALLAKGHVTGREGAVRMFIAAGIMLAPQPGGTHITGGGTFALLCEPDHVGTSVMLMVTWLVIDRAGTRRWVPVAAGVLLAWALVADELVLCAGVLPVLVVCGVRAYRGVVVERRPVSSARFEISLAVSALAAIPAAVVAAEVIHALGGFTVYPVRDMLATSDSLPAHLSVAFESVLTLFGADFFGLHMGLSAAGAFLHLTGLAMAGCAVGLALWRFMRGPWAAGLAIEVMAMAVPANLAAFVFSAYAMDRSWAREIVVVLPFGAVLAGRLLAGRLASARILPALAAVLAGYLLILAHGAAQRPQPTDNQQIAGWLSARHFRYGVAGYWEANSVTLATGRHVQVRAVDLAPGARIGVYPWQSNASWYDPKLHYANFFILAPGKQSYGPPTPYSAIIGTFGKPARIYRVGPYLILVWHKNLLAGLRCGTINGKPSEIGLSPGPPRCS